MIRRRRPVSAALAAGVALVLLAWVGHAQEPPSSTPFTGPEFVEADCPMWFDRPHGLHVDCGYVAVLEDRGRTDGNVIRLAVARLRASVPSPRPDPVIYLAGGPGVSAVESIDRFIWEDPLLPRCTSCTWRSAHGGSGGGPGSGACTTAASRSRWPSIRST